MQLDAVSGKARGEIGKTMDTLDVSGDLDLGLSLKMRVSRDNVVLQRCSPATLALASPVH